MARNLHLQRQEVRTIMIGFEEAFRSYRSGNMSWDRFVGHAVTFMNVTMCNRHRLTFDERSEIISDFYPRLAPLVENYEDQGSSFEAYLATTLFHCCRAYIRKKIRSRRFESTTLSDRDFESMVPEMVAEPGVDPLVGHLDREYETIRGPSHSDTVRRQLLYVFCKNVPLLPASDLARYSEMLDIPESWVQTVLEYAVRRHSERMKYRTLLRNRRNIHYSTMIRAECLLKETDSQNERNRIHSHYRRHRRLWLYHIHRLRTQNLHLSHREISLLLGISKGSVDSAVYTFSKRLAKATANR